MRRRIGRLGRRGFVERRRNSEQRRGNERQWWHGERRRCGTSATDRAWLAACVQDLGGGPKFRNEACAYCGDTDFEPVVEWWCDGEVVYAGGMAGTTLGVLAAPECMRVGSNLPSHAAYWGMAFTTDVASFVMCCLDAL